MKEIWKDIEGFENMYQVSNLGKVKSLPRTILRKDGKKLQIKEQILKGSKDTKGYIQVELKKDGKRNIKVIHRLVANAFISNKDNKEQVNHIDGNKENNCISNLEWVTCQENIQHAWKNNLNVANYGEKHPNHKLTEEQVKYIKENYKPRDKEYGARALARKFNVSTGPIQNILSGKGWKSINGNNK